MGTDKVIFVGEQWGATGTHVTGSDVSDRVGMRNATFCITTIVVQVHGYL
jgi:uncharacterized membrane protein